MDDATQACAQNTLAGLQPFPLCDTFSPLRPFPSPAGVLVDDAAEAYRASTANGGIGVRAPVTLKDEATGQVGSRGSDG